MKTSTLETVETLPNGYTRLVLRLRGDLVIPTTHPESLQLVRALNAIISERHAVEHRRHQAGKESRIGLRKNPRTL